MTEIIAAKGVIFELVQTPQPDGRVFEKARRAPGVRVIIADKAKKQLLLTREFRHELQAYDYRLPGGKVFNSLDEFEAFRQSGADIMAVAADRAKAEAAEEAGIDIASVEFVAKSTLGATVEWDLLVYEASDWKPHADGQNLLEDEVTDIVDASMYDYADVRQKIINGEMQEDRIAMILLRWLEAQV